VKGASGGADRQLMDANQGIETFAWRELESSCSEKELRSGRLSEAQKGQGLKGYTLGGSKEETEKGGTSWG